MSPILTPFDKPISGIKIADCEKLTVPSKSTPWNPENRENHGNIGVSSHNTCQSQASVRWDWCPNHFLLPSNSCLGWWSFSVWHPGDCLMHPENLWTCASSNAVLGQVLFRCLWMGVVWWTWDGCCSLGLGWVLFGWLGVGIVQLTLGGCCLVDLGWLLFGSCCSCVFVFFSNLLTFCYLRAAGRLPTDMLWPGIHHAWTKPEIWLSWCRHKPNGCNVLLHFWLSQWGHWLCWNNLQPSLKILQNAAVS